MNSLKNAKKFKGFSWRRVSNLRSVSDLFKDDPPLNLPSIKGLEKPDPLDVFDDEVLNRINNKVNYKTNTQISNQKPKPNKTNQSKKEV